MNAAVAKNLRRIREERQLSMEKLAEATGVSKTMLGQIERGESSPTITTLWKISNGLKLSFTALIEPDRTSVAVIAKSGIVPFVEDGGRYRLYPRFPYESGRRFEIYTVEIDPRGGRNSDPHGKGTEEFITVFAGALTVAVDGEEYVIPRGDSIRFKSDRLHAYRNAADETVVVSMVIYYPE